MTVLSRWQRKQQAAIGRAEEIASLSADAVVAELYDCLQKHWFRKFDRIIAALIRRRGLLFGGKGPESTARLEKVVLELQEQRPRLEGLLEDYQDGLPEHRLGEALLDALDEFERTKP